jgi:hypothetical protein
MKKGEVGGACIRYGKIRNTLKNLAWKPEVDGRLLLKCILKK